MSYWSWQHCSLPARVSGGWVLECVLSCSWRSTGTELHVCPVCCDTIRSLWVTVLFLQWLRECVGSIITVFLKLRWPTLSIPSTAWVEQHEAEHLLCLCDSRGKHLYTLLLNTPGGSLSKCADRMFRSSNLWVMETQKGLAMILEWKGCGGPRDFTG